MPPAVAAAFPEADDVSTRSDDEATKTSSWPTPKRGGKSRLYGVFMGGGTLDEFYNLNRRAIFKTAFQIRGPKAMQSAQKVLFDFKTDDTKIKFDGKLEIPKESTLLGKELDKADFIRELKSKIFDLDLRVSFPCLLMERCSQLSMNPSTSQSTLLPPSMRFAWSHRCMRFLLLRVIR